MGKKNRNNNGGGGYQGNNNKNNHQRGGHQGNNNRGGYQSNNNRGGYQGNNNNNNRGGYQGNNNNNNNNHGMSNNGTGPFWKDSISKDRVRKILTDHGYDDCGLATNGDGIGSKGGPQSYVAAYWSDHWKNHYENEFEKHKAAWEVARPAPEPPQRNPIVEERKEEEETLVNDDGDDFLERFIHKAEQMHTRAEHILTEGPREQDAILRYQFRSARSIDVSANLVNGRFKIANAWGTLSEQTSLLAHAAHYFYSRNDFKIDTIEDLKSFTRNLPESSRNSIRHLILMSRILRRKPQRGHLWDRTSEDVEVGNCIAQFPNLEQLTFVLGWDISDPAHRFIMGEWAHRSRNCQHVTVVRTDAETVRPPLMTVLNPGGEGATDQLEINIINEKLLSRRISNQKMEM